MKAQLPADLIETTSDLLATLSLFTQEEFNRIPFQGSWTAGQVAEHLYKSESNILKALKGNSKNTDRDPFEHTVLIRKIFLDYTTKLQSPEFILPSDESKNKNQLVKYFKEMRKELEKLMTTLDMDKSFTEFSFPQVGHFTGWECFCFIVCHSKRHIHQMKNIAEKLKHHQPNK